MEHIQLTHEEIAFLKLELQYMIKREEKEVAQLIGDEKSGAMVDRNVHDRALKQSSETLRILNQICNKLLQADKEMDY